MSIPDNYHILRTERIKGEECKVVVTQSGSFLIIHEDDYDHPIGSSLTLERAIEEAERVIRNHKRIVVEIPFTTSDLKPAIAVGRHARTRAILTKVNGKAESIYAYGRTKVLKPNIPTRAIERLKRLQQAQQKANDLIRAWEEKYSFDLGAAVDDAIKEQSQEHA